MENTNKKQNDLNDADEVTLVDFQATNPVLTPLDTDHEIEAPELYETLAEPKIGLDGAVTDFKTASPDLTESTVFSKTDIAPHQLALVKSLVTKIQEHSRQISEILGPYWGSSVLPHIKISQNETQIAGDSQVIEGVFNGQVMIGPDGQEYSIAANYASKSRLVEGDILKLTIMSNGTFVYKQIQPIERRRLTGMLEETETGEFLVNVDSRRWHILSASVTYYKAEVGDQVVIVIPKEGQSKWAAVENIIKR